MNGSHDWHSGATDFAKLKILIVDDEPANVALLEGILSESGYTRIKSVTDSRLAFDACNTFEPDLILLDWLMPHVDGISLLGQIRANYRESYLPVIVLTADTNENTKLNALWAGATDFLLKPFDHIEVLLRIRNVLETRRLYLLLDNQRAAFEDAVRARTTELREIQSQMERTTSPTGPTEIAH
jgi:PleD family two-component response regulator